MKIDKGKLRVELSKYGLSTKRCAKFGAILDDMDTIEADLMATGFLAERSLALAKYLKSKNIGVQEVREVKEIVVEDKEEKKETKKGKVRKIKEVVAIEEG